MNGEAVGHPMIRKWERVYRLPSFDADVVIWLYVSQHVWTRQPYTQTMVDDLGADAHMELFLGRARAFVRAFKTAGPSGRLP